MERRLDFAHTVDDWTRSLAAANVRPRTIDAYRRTLYATIDLLGERTDPRTLVVDDYERVLAAWQPHVAANTLRNRAMALRAFDAWLAVRRGGRGQARHLAPIRRDEFEPHRLSDADVAAIFRVAADSSLRDLAVVTLLALAFRNHEVRSLRVGDVDLAQDMITLREGKGGRGRVVPIGEAGWSVLAAHIHQLRKQSAGHPIHYLICRRHEGLDGRELRVERLSPDEPCGHTALNRLVTRLAAAAGLPEALAVSPHMFRRWSLEAFIAGTGDLHAAAELAGHRDVNQTRRYAGRSRIGRTRTGVAAVEAAIHNTRVAATRAVGAPGFEPGTPAEQPTRGLAAAPPE